MESNLLPLLRHQRMHHGLRLAVLAQQIGVAVVGDVVGGGGGVDEEDVAGVGEVEDALHVLRVQSRLIQHILLVDNLSSSFTSSTSSKNFR